MKKAFTLAETLITLGIIGVVAALTIPSLVSKYQKHVYYTQFRKAATVLENAINQYNFDHGCGAKFDDFNYDNLCDQSEGSINSMADKLSKYIQVTEWLNDYNKQEICKGYQKLPIAYNYDGSNRENEVYTYHCDNELGHNYTNGYGFITSDGVLINFATDEAHGNGQFVDINGPNKGPNIFGRDIFVSYIRGPVSYRWGFPEEEYGNCFGSNKQGDDCGLRLLQEGKMNY